MNYNEFKEIIEEFNNSKINELKLTRDNFSMVLKKDSISSDFIQTSGTREKVTVDNDELYIVRSPLVGVFYAAPGPDSPPFVKLGDHVIANTPLCIVEAMKIMNEIEADIEGEIIEILVKNEEVVEQNQPIMKIRRNKNV